MSLLGKEKLQLKVFLIQIALILFDILTVLSLSHIMTGLGNYITLQILLAQADIRIWETNLAGKLEEEVSWNSLWKMKNVISFTLSHRSQNQKSTLFFVFFQKFIYLLIFGCVGSSLPLRGLFFQLRSAGPALCCGAQASPCAGFSCCGAWAIGTQASVVVAHSLSSCGTRAQLLWHVGSSQTRVQTRVPCIGRRIFNHCATREALFFVL